MASSQPPQHDPPATLIGRIMAMAARRAATVRDHVQSVWARSTATRTSRRLVMAGAGVLAAALVVAGVLLLRPPAETLDGFIARWNHAVEENDDALYEALIAESVINNQPEAWLRGLKSVEQLHEQRKKLQPKEGPLDPDFIMVPTTPELDDDSRHATLAFQTDTVTTELRLIRRGWKRHWLITDVQSIASDTGQSTPLVVLPQDGATGEALTGSDAEPAVPQLSADTTPIDTELKLRQILDAWRTAWEQKEIDAYMAWYADYATIRRVTIVDGREIPEVLGKAELRRRMQRLARKYGEIEVDVANLAIQGSHAEAELSFRQEFTAWSETGPQSKTVYHDVGTKWLKFVNDQGEWRIYEEDWRNYVNVPSFPLN